MKNIAIVSYNIRCNFTNYGSALQSWALSESIKRLGYNPVLVDYCSNAHLDSNPLNPFKNMWDQDEKSIKMCHEAMPFIEKNYYKFDNFYTKMFNRTTNKYDYTNFNEIVNNEHIDGFVCGSDTIFCVDEFGIDDGFYANYDCMKKGYTVAYAASFGDSHISEEQYRTIDKRLNNFKAIGLREKGMIPYIKSKVSIPVEKVLDPTLLLDAKDYENIAANINESEKYLLLYSRRHNPKMIEYADQLAKKKGLKIIDISLRQNSNHEMRYDAGVEEFLNLVKNAEFIVTNSFHGMIFSVQFRKQFVIFSREQCDTKILELLELFGLQDRILVNGNENYNKEIDYNKVHDRINEEKKKSLKFLKMELDNCK